MAHLFLDTSYDITLGLLDDQFTWLEYSTFEGQKASRVLQMEALNFLNKHDVSPHQLKSLFLISGPGFYTGLRVSEGFADVFNFFQIPSYSFYSFDVPRICGFSQGEWFTKAYRGEYFLSTWTETDLAQKNIPQKNVQDELVNTPHLFIHSESALDDFSRNLGKSFTKTVDLLKMHPAKIFSHVLKNKVKKDSFYFRAPEDEFKVNP